MVTRAYRVIGAVLAVGLIGLLIWSVQEPNSPGPSQSGPVNVTYAKAPFRRCPVGIGDLAGPPFTGHDSRTIRTAFDGYAPTMIPEGFGLLGAARDIDGLPTAIWSDQTCRTITLTWARGGRVGRAHATYPHVGPWLVIADKPHACGNDIMGMGRCTILQRDTPHGVLTMENIGLSGAVTRRVALGTSTQRVA
jgi:hypothetical protein